MKSFRLLHTKEQILCKIIKFISFEATCVLEDIQYTQLDMCNIAYHFMLKK
jgi:hypothetical protein